MSPDEARTLAAKVAAATDQPNEWASGLDDLLLLDGREWLQLDRAARWFRYADGTPVSGVTGWLCPQLVEPSGFVSAVTSLHVDGRSRERATRALALASGPVAASALAVRLLDHVPHVRAQAWRSLDSHLGLEIAEPVLGESRGVVGFEVILGAYTSLLSTAATARGRLTSSEALNRPTAHRQQSARANVRRIDAYRDVAELFSSARVA